MFLLKALGVLISVVSLVCARTADVKSSNTKPNSPDATKALVVVDNTPKFGSFGDVKPKEKLVVPIVSAKSASNPRFVWTSLQVVFHSADVKGKPADAIFEKISFRSISKTVEKTIAEINKMFSSVSANTPVSIYTFEDGFSNETLLRCEIKFFDGKTELNDRAIVDYTLITSNADRRKLFNDTKAAQIAALPKTGQSSNVGSSNNKDGKDGVEKSGAVAGITFAARTVVFAIVLNAILLLCF